MLWLIIVIGIILIMSLSTILDSRFGQALADRTSGRITGEVDKLMLERIQLLEGEVERLGGDLQRLQEESDFLHKLIAERPAKGNALPPGEDSD